MLVNNPFPCFQNEVYSSFVKEEFTEEDCKMVHSFVLV